LEEKDIIHAMINSIEPIPPYLRQITTFEEKSMKYYG
jgi:hypothetical protein